jgi:hypothetical protein
MLCGEMLLPMLCVLLLHYGKPHVVQSTVPMNVSNVFESPLPAFFFLEGTSEGTLPRSWGISPFMGPWDAVVDDSCSDDIFQSPQASLRDHILPHTLQYWDAAETPAEVPSVKVAACSSILSFLVP